MISLIFETIENFEYDIRGLLMAFYPGEKISSQAIAEDKDLRSDEGRNTAQRILKVAFRTGIVAMSYENGNGFEKSLTQPIPVSDRTEQKNVVKRMLYSLLSQAEDIRLPWGTLTGIRPTKLVMKLIANGADRSSVKDYLEKQYLVSKTKIDLSYQIAKKEWDLVKSLDIQNGYSLYIGIPFCPTTCLYCSFTSFPISKYQDQVDEYITALCKEIDFTSHYFSGKKLTTIYLGGGTPTTLSADQMERLLSYIDKRLNLTYLQEYTVEAGRPDSITEEKLKVISNHPVDRISINPQTMNEATLVRIGRRHSVSDVRGIYYTARKYAFSINMDIILGLPGESLNDVAYTMQEIEKLKPDNLTVHSLAVKRASRLKMEKTEYNDTAYDEAKKMMELTAKGAFRMRMEPYYLYRQKNMTGNLENVGYAKAGEEGLYNILIMEELQSILALGAGAMSKVVCPGKEIARSENVKNIEQYLQRTEEMIERKKRLFSL